MFFQNPMLKDIAESAIDDTLEMTVANDTEGASTQRIDYLLASNSTGEAIAKVSGAVEPGMLLEQFAPNPEENPILADFWGMFTTGIANSGMFSNPGARADGQ